MHLRAASCVIGNRGGRTRGKAAGPSGKPPYPLPQILLLTPISPRPKNSLAEDTFNNVFLLKKKKKNTATSSPSVRPSCLALPGAAAERGTPRRGRARGALGAVGLLLLEQSHGELGAAPQPLQVAEAAAVIELLAEPGAAVSQGELLHQPWLHGPEEVEP